MRLGHTHYSRVHASNSSLLAAGDSGQVLALEQGAVGIVLEAMQAGAGEERLQERACAAVASLAREAPANQQQIGACGGLPLVLAAFRTHARQPRVLEQACSALAQLAASNENRESLRGLPGSFGGYCR